MGSWIVLAISGIAGFVVVAFGFPDWQIAVEPAQVLAGVVQYPAGNPVYVCYLKIWTILHQVGAVLLRAGMSEIRLSILISGLEGMLTFQAIAMFVYALSRNVILAIASVVVVIASGTATSGVAYPIFLLGTSHTWGALGLSAIVLAAALLGSGHHRLGLFVSGLMPAIHGALGVWFLTVAAASLAMDPAAGRRVLRNGWRALAAGVAIATVSLAVHLYTSRGIPDVPPDVTAKYVAAFTRVWDEHRRPVHFGETGVRLNLAALALAAAWLFALRRARGAEQHPPAAHVDDARFLLRFCAVAAVVSGAFVVLSWVPPERLPVAFVTLMPTRFANVNAMTFTALLIGLAGMQSGRRSAHWLTVVFVALLLLGRRSLVWEWMSARRLADGPLPIDSMAIVAAAASVLLGWAAVVAFRRRRASEPRRPSSMVQAVYVALTIAVVWIAAGPVRRAGRDLTVFRDRTNDLVFSTASRTPGLLLTGGDLFLIQVRARRPVLINSGALDLLAYAHAAAPALDSILRDVYAIDLFNPPPGTPRVAVVPPAYNRQVWQGYSPERWREIGGRYGISQVIVPTDWELTLPIVAKSGQHLLYEIR